MPVEQYFEIRSPKGYLTWVLAKTFFTAEKLAGGEWTGRTRPR